MLVSINPQPQRPAWLRAPAPSGDNYHELKKLVRPVEPAHRLRERGVSQRGGMLESAHGHFHDPGQRMHAALRFLRGAEGSADDGGL